MLHLRIHVPSDLRDEVLEGLDADPGVINLSMIRGAALTVNPPRSAAAALSG